MHRVVFVQDLCRFSACSAKPSNRGRSKTLFTKKNRIDSKLEFFIFEFSSSPFIPSARFSREPASSFGAKTSETSLDTHFFLSIVDLSLRKKGGRRFPIFEPPSNFARFLHRTLCTAQCRKSGAFSTSSLSLSLTQIFHPQGTICPLIGQRNVYARPRRRNTSHVFFPTHTHHIQTLNGRTHAKTSPTISLCLIKNPPDSERRKSPHYLYDRKDPKSLPIGIALCAGGGP